MEKTHLPFHIFLFSLYLPSAALAQFETCGNNYNCYYERKGKMIQEDRQRQEQQQEDYRNQQLQLQQEQLQEIKNQNAMLEEKLRELNERQGKMETLQAQQLDELKKQTPAAATAGVAPSKVDEREAQEEEVSNPDAPKDPPPDGPQATQR